MTRDDPELGPVRRCLSCREWWPDEPPFFAKVNRDGRTYQRGSCNACRADRRNGRPIVRTAVTHGTTVDLENRRRRDRERKAALRRDPVFGDKLRARQREAQQRFYERNRAAVLGQHRARYAAALDRPVREGFGRPRIAA